MATDQQTADDTLQRGVLPSWAVFALALGVLAPASTLALAIGVVVEIAGSLSWITWAVTSALMLGFAGGIGWLARRFTTTGGTYGLATHAGGRPGGYFVMVTHLSSAVISGPACTLGSAIYLAAWLKKTRRAGQPVAARRAVRTRRRGGHRTLTARSEAVGETPDGHRVRDRRGHRRAARRRPFHRPRRPGRHTAVRLQRVQRLGDFGDRRFFGVLTGRF